MTLAGPIVCDLLVVGSGAAGFAAGLTARLAGLDVLMIEKAGVFGGTSALSGGGVWVPGNRVSRERSQGDSAANALKYLLNLCGNRLNVPIAESYLAHCVEAIEFLEANSALRFGPNPIPDYRAELPGGLAGGRSLRAVRFDGRRLGQLLKRLRPPLASTTIFGGMMVSAEDLPDLFRAGRSLRSALRVAGMLARHAKDRLCNGRVTRLANGNALVAALATSYLEAGGQLWLDTPLLSLSSVDGRVNGAVVRRTGRDQRVVAQRGVVLAAGGAPHDTRAAAYPHVQAGVPHHSLAPRDNRGDTHTAAALVGAALDTDLAEPAAFTPVSLVPTREGLCGFPHFFDRSKPGFVAVARRGRRFANESDEYHVFARAMADAIVESGAVFLICDHRALRRYGVGPVRAPNPG